MVNKNYYVGVLLAASRNPLNKIQLVAKKNKRTGKVSLFSRVSHFHSPVDTDKMRLVGEYNSIGDSARAILQGKKEMAARGLSVPGIEMLEVR